MYIYLDFFINDPNYIPYKHCTDNSNGRFSQKKKDLFIINDY